MDVESYCHATCMLEFVY